MVTRQPETELTEVRKKILNLKETKKGGWHASVCFYLVFIREKFLNRFRINSQND